jgi:hypothetical protein
MCHSVAVPRASWPRHCRRVRCEDIRQPPGAHEPLDFGPCFDERAEHPVLRTLRTSDGDKSPVELFELLMHASESVICSAAEGRKPEPLVHLAKWPVIRSAPLVLDARRFTNGRHPAESSEIPCLISGSRPVRKWSVQTTPQYPQRHNASSAVKCFGEIQIPSNSSRTLVPRPRFLRTSIDRADSLASVEPHRRVTMVLALMVPQSP